MYVLDTDICSYLMKRTQPALIERVKTFAPRDLKVSVITLFELEYGILRSDRRDSLRRVVRAFLENVELLVWTDSAAREAGAVAGEERTGDIGSGRQAGRADAGIGQHDSRVPHAGV